jgi:hypothetical protein
MVDPQCGETPIYKKIQKRKELAHNCEPVLDVRRLHGAVWKENF